MANGIIVPNIIDTGWVLLAASVSPSNSPVYIRRVDDVVYIKASGWVALNTLTLPSDFRPSELTYLACVGNDGSDVLMGRLQINTNGTMLLYKATSCIGQVSFML